MEHYLNTLPISIVPKSKSIKIKHISHIQHLPFVKSTLAHNKDLLQDYNQHSDMADVNTKKNFLAERMSMVDSHY